MARRPPKTANDILRAIVRETDRGCVLVSAAWMDEQLRSIIEAILRSIEKRGPYPVEAAKLDKTIDTQLASTFDGGINRAEFCRAMGLITASMNDSLKALFQFRNTHFGHFAGTSRLTDPQAKDLLANFLKGATLPAIMARTKFPSESSINVHRHSRKRREFMNGIFMLTIKMMHSRNTAGQIITLRPGEPQRLDT